MWSLLNWRILDGWPLRLIAQMLDTNKPPDGQTSYSLAIALASGREEVVSLLLCLGANINAPSGKYGTPLAAAAYFGDKVTVSVLLDRGADIDVVSGEYGTALATAAYRGNWGTVSLLLKLGADPNVVGGRHGTALATAAYRGNREIVLLLLGRGADVNKVGGEHRTVLATAAHGGNRDIVSMLQDRGAGKVSGEYGTALAMAASEGKMDTLSRLLDLGVDINIMGGKYGTALATAAYNGKEDTVSLLLDRGADVNMVGGKYGTALATAAHGGNRDIVSMLQDRGVDKVTALRTAASEGDIKTLSLLLDLGVDINIVCGKYGTALATAAYNGKEDTVSLLLDRGADVNMVGGKYGTALATAIYYEKQDTVSLLLDRGADVNKVGGEYGTALATAAFCGNRETVLLLLDRGADVNMVDCKYGTALAAAAFCGNRETVLLLLDRGADVNMVGGTYGTALATAAYHGNREIVLLLLGRGADINKVGGEFGTALATFAFFGDREIVLQLLGRGADVNLVGGKYGTALATAVFRGDINNVSLLLNRGADPNMVGGKYGTALATAACLGNREIVLLLLGRGANVNLVGGKYGTALATFAFFGDREIVLQLLGRGADVNLVGGKYGTALATAASAGRTEIMSQLLKHGADVMCVGGKQHVDPINNSISWPPFPMPYTGPHHYSGTLSSSFILPNKCCGRGNLTPEQADVPCPKLEEGVLWRSLAALVGLHEDITLAKHQWISYDLCYFVAHDFDFGLAYAAARVAWKHFNEDSMDADLIQQRRRQWHENLRMLDEERLKVIEIDYSSSRQELITSPYSIMPRRLWDLKSNRVVDFQMLHAAAQSTTEMLPPFWAVSHSWTNDMSPVWTTINQHQWPVPLPKSISLDYLRSELLTLGAEYVWLDVVCLRQRGGVDSLEQLRQQEWKLDVPAIGNIYRAAKKIVRYFNGLGIRFSNDGWDDPRHWLQRAWTLQEIAAENTTINGGIPRDRSDERQVFLNSQGTVSGNTIKFRSVLRPVIRLSAQVDSEEGCEIYELAREMAKRHATQPLDKLSGLFYLLRTTKLPCYDEQKDSEVIWRQCFHLLPLERKAEILSEFPYRGSDEQWFPTWSQVLDWPTRDPEYEHTRQILPKLVGDTLGESLFIGNLWMVPDVILSETNYEGEYRVEIGGMRFGFYSPYISQKSIDIQDPPVFTLATMSIGHAHNWVVCKAVEKRVGKNVGVDGVSEVSVLKKVSVLRTDSCSELLVGTQNGVSLLQRVDCLFI